MTSRLEILNEKNYRSWSTKLLLHFRRKGIEPLSSKLSTSTLYTTFFLSIYSTIDSVTTIWKLYCNLLSVSALTTNGYEISFYKDEALIKNKDGHFVAKIDKSNNLYALSTSDTRPQPLPKTDLYRWHLRLGHLNIADIKKMASHHMARGLEHADISGDMEICSACRENKATRLPFPSNDRVTTETLELVHSDICMMPIEDLGKHRIMVSLQAFNQQKQKEQTRPYGKARKTHSVSGSTSWLENPIRRWIHHGVAGCDFWKFRRTNKWKLTRGRTEYNHHQKQERKTQKKDDFFTRERLLK